MLQGVFGRVSALINRINEATLEGPNGLTLAQTEVRRQDEIAWVFAQALEQAPSTNQIDVWHAIQEQLKAVSGKGSHFHEFGEITENDVIGYWEALPDEMKEELGLKEATILTKPLAAKPEPVGI